jgi:hypothetical protein
VRWRIAARLSSLEAAGPLLAGARLDRLPGITGAWYGFSVAGGAGNDMGCGAAWWRRPSALHGAIALPALCEPYGGRPFGRAGAMTTFTTTAV